MSILGCDGGVLVAQAARSAPGVGKLITERDARDLPVVVHHSLPVSCVRAGFGSSVLVAPGVASWVWGEEEGPAMYRSRFLIVVAAVLTGAGVTAAPVTLAFGAAGPGSAAASGSGWTSSVPFTNQVASSPTAGGGYPVPPGQTFPNPGTCRAGTLDSNHSESWIAVKPGTEDLVGNSKFFFDKYSKFYDFYLGSYRIIGGTPAGDNQVQGYDCVSAGTQAMPPSWTNLTDPNVAFDTKGRVYQTTLPFNAFWGGSTLHPDGEIDVSYSDDIGRHWVKGNGGVPLEPPNNASALQLGHVEDKQWIAVNDIPGSPFQDHVYSTWDVINGKTTKIRVAVSRDRGLSFSRAITLTSPSQSGPVNSSSYPSIDAAGNVYLGYESDPVNGNGPSSVFVTRSTDDGVNWGPFVRAAAFTVHRLPNTTFRLGIPESFAASPTYPGHLYVAYEDWDGTQMDVKFTQSTDGGLTWSAPVKVNDNVDVPGQPTDQFQPEVAAGPNGAVAVAFYDRRASCPKVHRGRLVLDATHEPVQLARVAGPALRHARFRSIRMGRASGRYGPAQH